MTVYDAASPISTLLSQWRTATEFFGNWTFNTLDRLKQEYHYL